MLPTDLLAGLRLPELRYGTLWLLRTGSGDPRHLFPAALNAQAPLSEIRAHTVEERKKADRRLAGRL